MSGTDEHTDEHTAELKAVVHQPLFPKRRLEPPRPLASSTNQRLTAVGIFDQRRWDGTSDEFLITLLNILQQFGSDKQQKFAN